MLKIYHILMLSAVTAVATVALAQGTRDPTVPPPVWLATHPSQTGSGLKDKAATTGRSSVAQMMVVGNTRRLAVIDGRVVKAGDEFDGSKVVSVTADKLVLEDESKSRPIAPNVTKQAPSSKWSAKKSVVLPAAVEPSQANGE